MLYTIRRRIPLSNSVLIRLSVLTGLVFGLLGVGWVVSLGEGWGGGSQKERQKKHKAQENTVAASEHVFLLGGRTCG